MAGEDPSKCPCDWCADYRRRVSVFALPAKERRKVARPQAAPPPPPAKRPSPRRKSDPRKFRRIREEDQVCRYCLSAPAESVDHIIPVSRGGTNREENLVGCCLACNSAKGDRLPKEAGLVLHVPLRLVRLASRRP